MDIKLLIDQFTAEQVRMIEQFAEQLHQTYQDKQPRQPRRKQLRNVYILKREGNTFSVRLQHKYGGKYLRGNIGTHEEAQRDAQYLDEAIEQVKQASVREYLLGNQEPASA